MRRVLFLLIGVMLLAAGGQPVTVQTKCAPASVLLTCAAPQSGWAAGAGEQWPRLNGRSLRSERAEEHTEESAAHSEAGARGTPGAGPWRRVGLIAFCAVAGTLLLWVLFICGTMVRNSKYLEDTVKNRVESDWENSDE